MRDKDLSASITDSLHKVEVGQKLIMKFSGLPFPITIKYSFAGGWIVSQTLIPGMPLELVRGEDGHLECIDVTFHPAEGIRLTD